MEFVLIGKIIKPQGIKGEVKILPNIDIPAIFNGKHDFYIEKKQSPYKNVSYRQGFVYVSFSEINDRETAEKYRNKKVYVSKETFESCAEDEFLINDLIGELLYDENHEYVGQIVDVVDYGFGDILVINSENHKYEVPFIKSIFKKEDGKLFVNRKEFEGAKVDQE